MARLLEAEMLAESATTNAKKSREDERKKRADADDAEEARIQAAVAAEYQRLLGEQEEQQSAEARTPRASAETEAESFALLRNEAEAAQAEVARETVASARMVALLQKQADDARTEAENLAGRGNRGPKAVAAKYPRAASKSPRTGRWAAMPTPFRGTSVFTGTTATPPDTRRRHADLPPSSCVAMFSHQLLRGTMGTLAATPREDAAGSGARPRPTATAMTKTTATAIARNLRNPRASPTRAEEASSARSSVNAAVHRLWVLGLVIAAVHRHGRRTSSTA